VSNKRPARSPKALAPNAIAAAHGSSVASESRYQLKGENGRLGKKIPGAAYQPTIDAILAGTMPEYVLVEFDTRFATVVFVDAFPGRLIAEERVEPRKPLSASARRAWVAGLQHRCRGSRFGANRGPGWVR
jgi:hypothetical protein